MILKVYFHTLIGEFGFTRTMSPFYSTERFDEPSVSIALPPWKPQVLIPDVIAFDEKYPLGVLDVAIY